MKTSTKQILYWSPRVLGILIALFLSLFAMDVFGEGHGFWGTIVALLMHLVPVYVVLIALAIGWRWEWAGAILFVGLAIIYLIWAGGRFDWRAYASISGPLFVTGILFLANGIYREQLRAP